jgi:hypothetical protein
LLVVAITIVFVTAGIEISCPGEYRRQVISSGSGIDCKSGSLIAVCSRRYEVSRSAAVATNA